MLEQGDCSLDALVERFRALCGSKIEGPLPMEFGAIEDEDWGEHADVHAVYPDTHCHRCKGSGHMAREGPYAPGVDKGGAAGTHGGEGCSAGEGGKGWPAHVMPGPKRKGKSSGKSAGSAQIVAQAAIMSVVLLCVGKCRGRVGSVYEVG